MQKADGRIADVKHVNGHDIPWQKLNIRHRAILNCLKTDRYKERFAVYVLHKLTQESLYDFTFICETRQKHEETEPFLKRLIMADRKWIANNNVQV